nr:3-keto-5-aminohexanoate cleavage protein [Roseibium album]
MRVSIGVSRFLVSDISRRAFTARLSLAFGFRSHAGHVALFSCQGRRDSRQASDAAEAGAVILHHHARYPEHGRPSVGKGRELSLLLVAKTGHLRPGYSVTTGGRAAMVAQERLKNPLRREPEMCSRKQDTMNFALYPQADSRDDRTFDWEKPFLETTDDLVFKNTPRNIASILKHPPYNGNRGCGKDHACPEAFGGEAF